MAGKKVFEHEGIIFRERDAEEGLDGSNPPGALDVYVAVENKDVDIWYGTKEFHFAFVCVHESVQDRWGSIYFKDGDGWYADNFETLAHIAEGGKRGEGAASFADKVRGRVEDVHKKLGCSTEFAILVTQLECEHSHYPCSTFSVEARPQGGLACAI